MVTFNLAYTTPLNPPGASPILTQDQAFAGIQRKIRLPSEFVPSIEKVDVVSDKDGVVKRYVTFKPSPPGQPGHSAGPAAPVAEVCKELPPNRADFEMEAGSSVINVISTGANNELFMTYIFAWKNDGLKEGSAEAREAMEFYKKLAKDSVESSVAKIRQLASNGEI